MTEGWFSAAELAALGLPGLPASKRALNVFASRWEWQERVQPTGEPAARERQDKGGGWEYHFSILAMDAQAALAKRGLIEDPRGLPKPSETPAESQRETLWRAWEAAPAKRKEKAKTRLEILQRVQMLEVEGGWSVHEAVCQAARDFAVSSSTIYGWRRLVMGVDAGDRLAALLPRSTAADSAKAASCTPAAWEFYKADWLRAERPGHAACYRRLRQAAAEHGWAIPSAKTLQRRIEKEVPAVVVQLARQGPDALKRMYPAQERNKRGLHALEWVVADGHRFDVMCRWPDGSTGRPCLMAFEDVYSGKILAWRIGKTENSELVQLCLGDIFREFGIPEHALLDNGRGFASKWITGGTPNRYRFKVKPTDPEGVLTRMDVRVHWATPFSGQSKPIERAFRDMHGDISTHPAFAGAYTGNSPMNKPHNYGAKAVDIEQFEQWFAHLVGQHNAREGRTSPVAAGRSFDEVFLESYRASVIRKATEAQIAEALLQGEGLTARKPDGALHLMGNRYWAGFLNQHIGKKLAVRFDPGDLHRPLLVYGLDGVRLGEAECIEAVGFADMDAARTHTQARKRWMRAQRELLEAARAYSPAEVAAMLPDPSVIPAMAALEDHAPNVVAMVPRRRAGNGEGAGYSDQDLSPAQARDLWSAGVALLRKERMGGGDD